MKQPIFILLIPLLFTFGCSSLNFQEIKSMKNTQFRDLELSAGLEHNELRIDVIRQYIDTYIDETTTYHEAVPYHPLGMDLGNGLFYDANGNLGFRIDYLMNFSPDEPFEIKKDIRPENDANIYLYTFINDALALTRMPQRKSKILYHKQNYNDSTVFIRKDRFRYAISISDSSMSYTYKNTKPVNIYKINDNRFYMQRKRKEREYIKRDNHIVLGKTFHIHLSDDRNSIIINSPWREQQNKKPILTIQKDDNRIFIFSKSYRGKKIEFTENGLLVTGTHVKPILYKKSSRSENLSTVSTANN